MPLETLIVDQSEGVATVTLNRPEALNAMNAPMRAELIQVMEDLGRDAAVRALIVTGAGRAFCAGGDVKAMLGLNPLARVENMRQFTHRWLSALANMEKPTIAAVNGIAAGGGCNLALACDIIIASEEARFSEIFVRIGLIPDIGGMHFLPRLVGMAKAKELCFTGDIISAQESAKIGLVNKVVPAAELMPTARELALRLAKGPTKAIGIAKSILNRSFNVDLPSLLEYEALGQGLCFQTEDHKEGVQAFLEKREARFQGR